MEYYSNEIINIINNYDNYPIKYIDCDMYSNNFIDINDIAPFNDSLTVCYGYTHLITINNNFSNIISF